MKFIYLRSGWREGKKFAAEVEEQVSFMEAQDCLYYDIKISSKGDHCLLIFKEIED